MAARALNREFVTANPITLALFLICRTIKQVRRFCGQQNQAGRSDFELPIGFMAVGRQAFDVMLTLHDFPMPFATDAIGNPRRFTA